MYTWFRLPMDPAAIHPSLVQSTLKITSSFPRGTDSALPDSRSYIPMFPSSTHSFLVYNPTGPTNDPNFLMCVEKSIAQILGDLVGSLRHKASLRSRGTLFRSCRAPDTRCPVRGQRPRGERSGCSARSRKTLYTRRRASHPHWGIFCRRANRLEAVSTFTVPNATTKSSQRNKYL